MIKFLKWLWEQFEDYSKDEHNRYENGYYKREDK